MAEHSIRQATATDFEDVVNIGQVIPFDYLPYRYPSFMDDPNVTSYVYVIGDEVVGFCSVFLLDDGQTYHVRAGRVKQGYRGQGVYGQLMKRARDDFRTVVSLRKDVVVVEDVNYRANKDRLLKTYNEIHRKDVLYYKMAGNKKINRDEICPVYEVTTAEMISLFQTQSIVDEFFPNNIIIVDWVPLQLLQSNLKYVLGQDSLALESKNEDGSTALLSVSTPVPCLQNTFKYQIDVMGSDVTSIRHHVIRHIRHARSIRGTDIIFPVFVPCDERLTLALEDVMISLGLPREKVATHNALIVLDRKFK